MKTRKKYNDNKIQNCFIFFSLFTCITQSYFNEILHQYKHLIYTNLYCSCESLTTDECKMQKVNCKVDGSECITHKFSCADMTETQCASYPYECKWDTSYEDYSFKCSDFSNDQAKSQQLNCEWKNSSCESCPCLWNKSNVCEEFSKCENYSIDQCPSSAYGCEQTETDCITLVCSDIKDVKDCGGDLKDEKFCAWNNNEQCVELSKDSDCTDLGDFKIMCSFLQSCKYVNGSCTFSTCADFTLDDCELRKAYVSKNEFKLCTVSESKCIELTDTTQLTKDNCGYETSYNYHWTNDGKCEECAELISENSTSEIILGIIIMMILLVA